jgi:hypothetical protein
MTSMVAELLELRRTHRAWRSRNWPEVDHDDGLVTLRHRSPGGDEGPDTLVLLNFSGRVRHLETRGRLVFGSETPTVAGELAPWSAAVVEAAGT